MPPLHGRRNDYLAYDAWRGVRFLHPGGRAATDWLLEALRLGPGTTALEIGVGLGATAALVAERTSGLIVGLDRLPPMLDQARQQVEGRAGGGRVLLVRADAERGLPFRDGVFDAVYAESVVGLLDIERVIPECARVLRPGGRLGMNDGIWRPGLSQAQVDEQNAWTRHAFGIPAGTPGPDDHAGWARVIEAAGLTVEVAARLESLIPWPPPPGPNERDLGGYVRHPRALLRRLRFERYLRVGRRFSNRMEAWVFIARKPGDAG